MEAIMSFLPITLMGMFLSIFTYKIAERTNKNKWVYVLLTLIPGFGFFFFVYTLLSSVLIILDQINYLKSKTESESDKKFEV